MGDRRLGEEWSWGQRWKNDALYRAAELGLWGARSMGDGWRRDVGRWLGRVVSWAWRGGRAQAQRRLDLAFGASMPVTVEEVFQTLGQDLADTVSLFDPGVRAGDRMPLAMEGREVLDDVLGRSRGRGVVFVTAHLGPIDVMAASVAEQKYRVVTLARESYDPRFTVLYDALRVSRGVRPIYRGRPGMHKAILRALADGVLVGFPIDLVGRGMRACHVPFLGEVAPIASGAASLARRLAVPLVVGSPAPTGSGLHVTVEPLDARILAERDDQAVVEALACALERRIRALPAHWPWMHKPNGGN